MHRPVCEKSQRAILNKYIYYKYIVSSVCASVTDKYAKKKDKKNINKKNLPLQVNMHKSVHELCKLIQIAHM